jgi:hypothetical protein
MLAEEIARAITAAPTARALDVVANVLWRAARAGAVDESDAGRLGNAVEARRTAIRLQVRPIARPPSRPRRMPAKADLLARRRRCAASGALPTTIACLLTPGQISVVSIVVMEIRDRGRCDLYLDAIAARAGVSRSLAKEALRQARLLGIL